jgi:hypothetical protein
MFEAIAFAGGGNRCYWQGGFWEAAASKLGFRPKLVTGVSAGAFAAVYSLLGIGPRVRELVVAACKPGAPNAEWRRLMAGKSPFPVAQMYRDLLEDVLDQAALERLNALTDLRIAMAHPPRWLPARAAALAGLGAYQLEKKLFHPVHPRFGKAIGFRPVFADVRAMRTVGELVDAIYNSASVPPIMPLGRHAGRPVVDGGMVDNVPVAPLEPIETEGGRTLVLLTRKYRKLPEVANRTYVQPSEPISIGQFEIGDPDGIIAAYELGLRDGTVFAAVNRQP